MGSAVHDGERINTCKHRRTTRSKSRLIGAGGMGQGDARTATSLPGVKLVAAADIYDGRLARIKEVYGSGVFTTRDYREMLARPDIDAVIIATPDHWHATITKDALAAKKDVYCEKPMVKKISEGQRSSRRTRRRIGFLQVGSQYASSIVFREGRAADEVRRDRATQHGGGVARSQHRHRRVAVLDSAGRFASRTSIGIAFSATLPSGRSNRSAYSAGAITATTAPGSAGDLFVHLLTGLARRHRIARTDPHLLLRRHSILEGRARCSRRDAGCAGLSEDGRSSRVHASRCG